MRAPEKDLPVLYAEIPFTSQKTTSEMIFSSEK